jgi:hypothetical protein
VLYAAQARTLTGTTLLVDGGQHLVPSTRDVMFLAEPAPQGGAPASEAKPAPRRRRTRSSA